MASWKWAVEYLKLVMNKKMVIRIKDMDLVELHVLFVDGALQTTRCRFR